MQVVGGVSEGFFHFFFSNDFFMYCCSALSLASISLISIEWSI